MLFWFSGLLVGLLGCYFGNCFIELLLGFSFWVALVCFVIMVMTAGRLVFLFDFGERLGVAWLLVLLCCDLWGLSGLL